MADSPTVISVFSGAGGLDYGFEAAGFETRLCLDFDADACRTLRANRNWTVLEADIEGFSGREILARGCIGWGTVDVLMGGPPCQPFSKSGFWVTGDVLRLRDPRASTVSSYLRLVRELAPRVLFFENVRGFAFAGKTEGLQLLLAGLDDINAELGTEYAPAFRVLQAADYGVPQLRERFIMVADRSGKTFDFDSIPRESERTAWDVLKSVGPDAHEDLRVRGRWAGLLPTIPEGQNYLWHTERGGGMPLFGWRRRYWNFLLKLAKEKPSWTIQAQPGPAVGPFHWENRRLSWRELARLQTFPVDVEVTGTSHARQRQIGNAVPSLLAEKVAREIKRQLLGHGRCDTCRLLPLSSITIPPPEPTREVPSEYLRLVGDHEAHPGTGRGFGARTAAQALG